MAVPKLTRQWTVIIHDQGHYIHNAQYKFGSAYAYTMNWKNSSKVTLYEIEKKDVTYLNDERSPCQFKPRAEEMNTCIQHHIEKKVGCQLPWHNKSTNLPRCTEYDQYREFLTSYDWFASLDDASIAKVTGCLPSCRRNEFKMKVYQEFSIPPIHGQTYFACMFFYPSGAYIEKSYYYTYDLGDYIGDVGGYMGLLLGCSLLGFYDWLKRICKKMLRRMTKTYRGGQKGGP